MESCFNDVAATVGSRRVMRLRVHLRTVTGAPTEISVRQSELIVLNVIGLLAGMLIVPDTEKSGLYVQYVCCGRARAK